MRIVVLGLDGATFDLILPGVERGELPAFARLTREGAWGPLRSTIPADSPSAWTTFATGVNPGRHGVYGFMMRQPGSYDCEIGSSKLCRAPTLWELASRHGRRVGIINVPFTYPPQPVNGFLVAGMMTPDLKSCFTYPAELRDELLQAVPNYSIGHGLGRMRKGDPRNILVRDFASTIAARERAMRWLAAKFDPDLLVCAFTVLDRLQHFLWADMDERHPDHVGQDANLSQGLGPTRRGQVTNLSYAKYREAIATAYRQLDGVVAQTLADADDETLLVVLSDHGFEAVARTFYVNVWLAERGLLALTGRRSEPSRFAGRAAHLARYVLGFVPGCDEWRERLRARRMISEAFLNAIDWRRTRAWFGLDRGLWLNVAGRDPLGMVSPGEEYESLRARLIAELESLEDPETGHRVVRKVHRCETLYRGDALSHAPDLIIEPARHADDPRGRYILSERLSFPGAVRFVGSSAPISGYHSPEGIVLLWGKNVPAGMPLTGATIADIAPSLLEAMNLPGAEEMEGRPLLDVRKKETEAEKSTPEKHLESAAPHKPAEFSEKEKQIVEQQLKNLGYLD